MLSDEDGFSGAMPLRKFGSVTQIGETFFWMGVSWTARNPGEAIAATAVLANPTLRGVALKMLRHQLGQMAVDLRFYGRLAATDLVGPTMSAFRRYATRGLTHPATIGGAAVLTGAAICAANVQMVNDNAAALNPALQPGGGQTQTGAFFDLFRSDLPRYWTPFGGYGSMSVV